MLEAEEAGMMWGELVAEEEGREQESTCLKLMNSESCCVQKGRSQ